METLLIDILALFLILCEHKIEKRSRVNCFLDNRRVAFLTNTSR